VFLLAAIVLALMIWQQAGVWALLPLLVIEHRVQSHHPEALPGGASWNTPLLDT